jgi:hypothetical protein
MLRKAPTKELSRVFMPLLTSPTGVSFRLVASLGGSLGPSIWIE